MSIGVDLGQFYQTFFDEADELLADMERLLLELDVEQPDMEHLNAIFRAAHSIKGGAATFGCFGVLAETTHLLESLLDPIRQGEMKLRPEMIDIFLETKDVLKSQLDAYRAETEPDPDTYEHICGVLRQLAQEKNGAQAPAAAPAPVAAPAAAPAPATAGNDAMRILFSRISEKDAQSLLDEMGNLGKVLKHEKGADSLTVWMETTCSKDDVEAVCCFIINEDQIAVDHEVIAAQAVPAVEAIIPEVVPAPVVAPVVEAATEAAVEAAPARAAAKAAAKPVAAADKESGSIRVGVEKVDQMINLVGELVITQAMLTQIASSLDPVLHDRLLNGLEQLERNARDLQESVMSMRMMQMDYVFSRFPRVVRDLCTKTGKKIRLETQGKATELDKSLIERIIDPLTHLVRNSMDHGIEDPEARAQKGKNPEGVITMSAQHVGGNIVIEVSDDGNGLNKEKILAKAAKSGMVLPDNITDEEIWQLIFAPGFSTAEQVTSISGRGVGMDVVRRNIQDMGGHVKLYSEAGKGTRTQIILPLTLAILDGMSVRVGSEVFILPLNHVTESIQPQLDQIHSVAGNERVIQVRGEYLPLVELHRTFSVDGAQEDPSQAIAVIMHAQERRFALLVDHLIGQHQVVVKNLEANYRKVPGISAATILGDGSVALIIDVFAMARSSGRD
ncbi:chemotaxis protein CheA [Corticimicrobacter populi]|uniref:Chemotaxis protein CheA n=1 Tax=Corticimicrobacter populi TaxID=2175229 RepID=A0A2V1JXT1_9BURK|nr:chemotaxis protein CheA [Corticimicrobacter populi]PWF21209.1 chemotaxis protein CheA [Corticimicrobacter populi]